MTASLSLSNKHRPCSAASERQHIARLNRLAPLRHRELEALETLETSAITVSSRRELVHVDAATAITSMIVRGWAVRVRDFRDGRRQILHLLLPGDLIDPCPKQGVGAAATVVALTDVAFGPAPDAEFPGEGLCRAYAANAALEHLCLNRHIARLGRLDAYERLADLLLELSERLGQDGAEPTDRFYLPFTQEMLADYLGLTSVHVNRVLQQMRRENVIISHGSFVRLVGSDQLRAMVDYKPLGLAPQPRPKDIRAMP